MAISAPSSPGEASSVSASGSAAMIASAPLACSAAIAGAQVAHRAGAARILQQRAEHLGLVEIGEGIADDKFPAQRLGAGAQHRDRLRMHVAHRRRTIWSWPCAARSASAIASAAAVASSSSEALATSSPVRSQTMVWKLNSASSRPWLISG